jgi:hypothetical protein
VLALLCLIASFLAFAAPRMDRRDHSRDLMTYGGGAAIHAILLAAFGPVRGPDIPAMEFAPLYYHPREVTEIYDPDIDAAFAVTVTGCLFILPLGMWSKVFRRTRTRLRLILWSFLMLGRAIYGLQQRASFWQPVNSQIRICRREAGWEELPFRSSSRLDVTDGSWNKTMWTLLGGLDESFPFTQRSPPACIYPCLSAQSPLRQDDEATIYARAFFSMEIATWPTRHYGLIYRVAYRLVFWAGILCVSLAVLQGYGGISWIPEMKRCYIAKDTYRELTGRNQSWITRSIAGLKLILWLANLLALVLTPITVLIFSLWIEFTLSGMPKSEPIQLIGQWAPLVAVGFVALVATIDQALHFTTDFHSQYRIRRRSLKDRGTAEPRFQSMHWAWRHLHRASAEEFRLADQYIS